MRYPAHSVERLLQPGELQKALNAIDAGVVPWETCVGLCRGDELSFAASGVAGGAAAAAFHTGCITKLFIATLIRRAFAEGWLSSHMHAADCVAPDPLVQEHLGSITILQLLEHTHGLDDSSVRRVPRHADGRIDPGALCRQWGSRPLFTPPGTYYSYSHSGAWLLSAILEQRHGVPIEHILRTRLLGPLGIEPFLTAASGWPPDSKPMSCPSSGGWLTLTLRDVMRFLQLVMRDGSSGLAELPEMSGNFPGKAVPGLSPLEQAVYRGWKIYGGGWFGHHSQLPGALALIRLHPQQRIAFAIVCSERSPLSVATALLGRALPGFSQLSIAKLLGPAELRLFDAPRFVGSWANAAGTLSIVPGPEGRLLLRTDTPEALGESGVVSEAIRLAPARDNVLMPLPPRASLPFVQLIGESRAGFSHLWDGTSVRPRQSPEDSFGQTCQPSQSMGDAVSPTGGRY